MPASASPGPPWQLWMVEIPAACRTRTGFHLEVRDVAMLWHVSRGLLGDRIWRVTLRRTWEERADERPTFAVSISNVYAV